MAVIILRKNFSLKYKSTTENSYIEFGKLCAERFDLCRKGKTRADSLMQAIGSYIYIFTMKAKDSSFPTHYGCKVKPTTRYAFSVLGLAATWANTGTLKLSVILMSLVAFKETFVTAKPLASP